MIVLSKLLFPEATSPMTQTKSPLLMLSEISLSVTSDSRDYPFCGSSINFSLSSSLPFVADVLAFAFSSSSCDLSPQEKLDCSIFTENSDFEKIASSPVFWSMKFSIANSFSSKNA